VNLFEYPVWLITGLLVPLSLLPGWVQPLAWLIGPTWGIKAIHAATTGGSPGGYLAVAGVLALASFGLGVGCLHHFEKLARRRATLSLT
jgi:ABC-2 type transport system permease protein